MGFLSQDELKALAPAETAAFPGPIPTQIVSSDEYFPAPQSVRQCEVEARTKARGDTLAQRHGMSRRQFFRTASGMAAAFLAMNEVYGRLYDVSVAEAQAPDAAKERAAALSKQFVMDCHTHFLRDDTRIMGFVRQREAVGKAGWNPALAGKPQTIEDLKFANYFKEVFLDSDTTVALISGSPSDIPQDWFLTNEMKAQALGGPLEGTSEVLLVMRATTSDEVRSRLAEDPWARKDLLRITRVAPWTLRLGSLA